MPHQLAQRCRHTDGADQSRHVVPDVGSGWRYCQRATQSALDFMGQDQRMQKVHPFDRVQFRMGQQGCNSGCRRVDDRLDMRVVVGMQPDTEPVDERRAHGVQTLVPTDHAANAIACQGRQPGYGLVDRRVQGATVRAPDPVEKRARGLVANVSRDVCPA
jgi:hypothetical protein